MGTKVATGSTNLRLDASGSSPAALLSPEVCVICLDRVTEKAVALPCGHGQFDFPCLGTWLQQQSVCPLCKREVKAIRYDITETGDNKIFYLPHQDLPQRSPGEIERRRHNRRAAETRRRCPPAGSELQDDQIQFRRRVYRDQLYSLRVGTNKISRYRNITAASFVQDEQLASRARKWIRRELAVFEFLSPDSASFGSVDRRASNAEFLLEYIVSILRSIEIRGSSGQAEELLAEFLGRDNARLFLHELEAWLRSPYNNLDEWDANAQYG